MKLTEHFSLDEFTISETAARAGVDNVPPLGSPERANLERIAQVMEEVRSILGHPILISSGYRGPWVNSAVGGSKNSAHMGGLAADFICPGFGNPLAICHKLRPHMKELGIDQLIHEFDTWVHLGLAVGAPRHMALTIDRDGTQTGFV